MVSKPIPIPHPVPVPHPITLAKPIYIPVPKAVPIPQSAIHDDGGFVAGGGAGGDEHVHRETANYSSYAVNVQDHAVHDQQNSDQQAHFQPSQANYSA